MSRGGFLKQYLVEFLQSNSYRLGAMSGALSVPKHAQKANEKDAEPTNGARQKKGARTVAIESSYCYSIS